MATMLFSTIGQAVGGPLGAAIGLAVGGSLDSALFGRGSGSGDLFVQRSAYGDVVPRVYGRMRVAGSLVWVAPMAGMGGKGSGRRSGGAGLAIILSSGPVRSVGRIWADGREIRNAAGEGDGGFKVRLWSTDGPDGPDPLLAAAEGLDRAPAFRGFSYVVVEDLDLAPFGSRIPNLSFEIDSGETDVSDWLADAAQPAGATVEAREPWALSGFLASAERGRDALSLAMAGDFRRAVRGGDVAFVRQPRLFEIGRDDLVPPREAGVGLARDPAPSACAFGYLDPERDFQAGLQRAARARPGTALQIQLPLAAGAAEARSIAEHVLQRAETASDSVQLTLPWRWLGIEVGDWIQVDGAGPWLVVERLVRGLMVHLRAERDIADEMRAAGPADPGRAAVQPVQLAGPTALALVEAPVAITGATARPAVWAGGLAGWRGAEVQLLEAGELRTIGRVGGGTPPHGVLVDALGPGPLLVWDERNALLVAPVAGEASFQSRSAADVLAGANLAMVGGEILQYRDASVLSDGRVRLSGLLRGRFGTGFRMVPHGAGSWVIGLQADRLASLPLNEDAEGRAIDLVAQGAGDPPGGTSASCLFEALADCALAPVHLEVEQMPDGAIRTRWRTRSVGSWAWGSADPGAMSFWWHLRAEGGRIARIRTEAPEFVMEAERQMAELGEICAHGDIWVEVIGRGPLAARQTAMMRF